VADGIGRNRSLSDLDGFVQIEVTSRCNLSCPACPHGALGGSLSQFDMPRDLFERIVDQTVRPGRRYHLQGWGEPLLRDDLPELVRSISERGGRPSITTNGTLITPPLADELVAAGLDFITVTIGGGNTQAQRSNRPGAELETVLDAVRALRRARKRQRIRTPLLAASYELTRSSVASLPEAVARLKKAGARKLIAIQPMLTLTAAQERNLLACVTDPAEQEAVERALRRATVATMWRSLPFHCDPIDPDPEPVCREDPLGSLFVGAGGEVSPCVFLGLPTDETLTIRCLGREASRGRVSMGSLHRSTLAQIWNGPEYAAFRQGWGARRAAAERGSSRGGEELEPPLPHPCRGCPRALGY
jgi:MoaA/NifB/PqqE/SkfB family radical SAM enzyme